MNVMNMNVTKRSLGVALAVGFSATVASATDLNVTLRTASGSAVEVGPGAIVNYEVVGELTDALNEGLALWACDIAFTGGALAFGVAGAGMGEFAEAGAAGITNPAGYGGTDTVVGREGELVQAGGGMNTILNDVNNAAFPLGTVVTGIAQPGFPEVLMTGSLTVPAAPGTYMLTASNCFGNVIKQGETLDGTFWATEPFGVGAVTNLAVTVAETCAQAANLDFTSLALTQYPCDAILSRKGNNILRFAFDIGVAAPVPGAIEINKLDPVTGAPGPDISASFDITVVGGNVLTITETGQVFENNAWYAIRNVGSWCEAGNFEVDYGVAYGDVDGFGGTGFNDLNAIFGVIQNGPPANNLEDSSRFDIDNFGGVGFNDLNAVFGEIGSSAGVKPSPAGCTP